MTTRKKEGKSLKIFGLCVFLAFVILIPVAKAQTPFDITYCDSGTSNAIYRTPELTLVALEGKGITMSHHENKALHNLTFEFIGNYKIVGGKRQGTGYMTFKDQDGDFILLEFEIAIPDKSYKFFYGTGKWKGMKGEGKGTTTVVGTLKPGTFQSCTRIVGTFEVAK